MKLMLASFALVTGLAASAAFAQTAPATAPAGTTGMCKDGTFSANDTKKGACAGHKGVKEWYAAAAVPATMAKPVATTASAPAAAAPMAAAPSKPAAAAPMKPTAAAPAAAPAAGGGPGQVWVNPTSKTYHCPGTKYYGKTKQGEYMTEAAAKAAGNHADHKKACTT